MRKQPARSPCCRLKFLIIWGLVLLYRGQTRKLWNIIKWLYPSITRTRRRINRLWSATLRRSTSKPQCSARHKNFISWQSRRGRWNPQIKRASCTARTWSWRCALSANSNMKKQKIIWVSLIIMLQKVMGTPFWWKNKTAFYSKWPRNTQKP